MRRGFGSLDRRGGRDTGYATEESANHPNKKLATTKRTYASLMRVPSLLHESPPATFYRRVNQSHHTHNQPELRTSFSHSRPHRPLQRAGVPWLVHTTERFPQTRQSPSSSSSVSPLESSKSPSHVEEKSPRGAAPKTLQTADGGS